jgi:HK97 family phage major capsid protein
MDIQKMKRERKEKIDAATIELRKEVDAILAKGADATAEEREACDKKVAAHKEYCDRSEADIAREERLAALEAQTAKPVDACETPAASKSEYRHFIDFIHEAMSRPVNFRETTLGNPSQAGLLVPPEFAPGLRMIDHEKIIVRPRAHVYPSTSGSPDATLNVNALDQFGANGRYAGVTTQWVGETDRRENTADLKVTQISLTPNAITATAPVSNTLLNNSAEAGKYLQQLMAAAIAAEEEMVFLRGSGVARPLGFIGHPSNIVVSRTTPGAISYSDVIEMETKTVTTAGEYVFIASRSATKPLKEMKDAAGNLIWQPDARVGAPGTLMGIPIIFSERVPALGTSGDLTLVDLSYYGIKDGSPFTVLADPYSEARYNRTVFIVSWSVDGKPLLTTPIKCEDNINRSAFVVLS